MVEPIRIPLPHLAAPPDPERRFRFMEIVRRKLRERRYSRRTEEAYVYWIRRFIVHFGRRHPRELGTEEVTSFLSTLVVTDGLSASTQNQAMAALVFLYDGVIERPLGRIDGIAPARPSRHVPVVLSERELRLVIEQLSEPYRLCAMLMYGSGLRLLECLSLRVKDVDIDRREIVIRAGKGDKDRRTPLAEVCVAPIERLLKLEGRRFDADRRRDIRTSGIAAALARKYPRAEREWQWRFLLARAGPLWIRTGCAAVITCTSRRCSERCSARLERRGSRSERPAIRFAIRLRRICWRAARTFARFRSCSGTLTSKRR